MIFVRMLKKRLEKNFMNIQNKLIKSVGVDKLLHFSYIGWIGSYFSNYVFLPNIYSKLFAFVV